MRASKGETELRRTVAVIGSFRQHYPQVLDVIAAFRSAGWSVVSPAGSGVLDPGIEFVRFETDDTSADDPTIQSVTMERILSAHVVYVVSPEGYIGRTTCYEVGRVRQNGQPLYFSERPKDLPIEVPEGNVMDAADVARLAQHRRLEETGTGAGASIERRLVTRGDS